MSFLTRQQIFDKVATHLLTQNKRAMLEDTRYGCAYRAPDGCKCAIGCLIPDELYPRFAEYERICAGAIPVELFAEINIDKNADTSLIARLQHVHDDLAVEPSAWKNSLKALAYNYQLDAKVLDAFPDPQP